MISYQTTVPESVRRALHLGKRDKIRFTLQSDGKIVLTRADDSEVDPVLGQFLGLLAKDIAEHPQHKHWFCAKFFQQYRLFFRYHQESKIIIYAWVNDDNTKRAYGSSTDAYRVFRRMIESGHPPDDWKTLLKEAKQESKRLQDTLETSGEAPC